MGEDQGLSWHMERWPPIHLHDGNTSWPVMTKGWSIAPEKITQPAWAERFLPVMHILMNFCIVLSAASKPPLSVCSSAWSCTQKHISTLKSLFSHRGITPMLNFLHGGDQVIHRMAWPRPLEIDVQVTLSGLLSPAASPQKGGQIFVL